MKKDTNYLAAVEKAIVEKYGKATVQDFRSEWEAEKEKKYLGELNGARKRARNQKNKQTHRPKDDRGCGVCKTYSFSRSDDLYMNRFKCCKCCYIDFVDANEENWQNGWRPSPQQINLSKRRRK
jgi:hypothetical protein